MTLAWSLDALGRFTGAILLAFAGIALVKSRPPAAHPLRWLARVALAVPLFAAALWTVAITVPYPALPTVSIVAGVLFVAGLAVEELIGADIRRLLGI